MRIFRKALVGALLVATSLPAAAQQAVSVFAEGSLREALTAIAHVKRLIAIRVITGAQ